MLKTFKQLLTAKTLDEQIAVLRELNETPLTGESLAKTVNFIYSFLPERPEKHVKALDLVGTGGDVKGTFNISTITALYLAKQGIPIAKSGSVATSSRSGSMDCLLALGIQPAKDLQTAKHELTQNGQTFLSARDFYPQFAHTREARLALRDTGERTIMNVLGPLLNPLNPRYQVIGTYSVDLLQPMAEAMHLLGRQGFVVTSEGTDELTLSPDHHILEVGNQGIQALKLDLPSLGFHYAGIETLQGGSPDENAALARAMLAGEVSGPKHDVVALNAMLGERAYYGT